MRVEHRATRRAVVYEAVPVGRAALSKLWGQGSGRHGDATETHVVTLVAEPPEIATPSRPDLHELLEQHWPATFPLIDFGQTPACGCCTREAEATVPDQLVPWPCPTVAAAIESVPCPAVSVPAGPGAATHLKTGAAR